VPAAGGDARPITELDTTLTEATHRYPCFLPDGEHFLYLARRGGAGRGEKPAIYCARVSKPGRTLVLGVASNVVFSAGHLLYAEDGNLMAQPFDASRRRTTGPARPLTGEVRFDTRFSRGAFAASRDGLLAYMTGPSATRSQLQWRGRDGTSLGDIGEPADYAFGGVPELDPTGRRAAVATINVERGTSDIWVVDLASGRRRRLSVDDEDRYSCAWSPDGRHLYVNSLLRAGGSTLDEVDVEGTGVPRPVFRYPGYIYASGVSPDGRWVLATLDDPKSRLDAVALPVDGKGAPLLVAGGPTDQSLPRLSPDGRWVEYESDESGRPEVYVRTFPPGSGKWQVSANGGRQPRWDALGRALVFLDPENRMTSVGVSPAGGGLEFGEPERLFRFYGSQQLVVRFDLTRDGRRFLVTSDVASTGERPLTLLTDWTETLRR
jgi:dipeptidyl aminopeptidase/acylaminoacyl peptidase